MFILRKENYFHYHYCFFKDDYVFSDEDDNIYCGLVLGDMDIIFSEFSCLVVFKPEKSINPFSGN